MHQNRYSGNFYIDVLIDYYNTTNLPNAVV